MKDYTPFTDEELIEMLRQGNEDVMDYLIDKYKSMVRKKARVLYLVGGDQDDLIQEGMIGLFKAVRDYRKEKDASFHTFAQLCVDRQLYHAIQSSNRQKHQPLNAYVSLSLENSEEGILNELVASSAETVVLDRENVQIMQEKIKECLSPLENKVLDSYLKGNDYLKIAEQLGRSPKSVDNALQRIRGKVRECILGK